MTVRTVASLILSVALMASAAGVPAAGHPDESYPYTGPNSPVMTTA